MFGSGRDERGLGLGFTNPEGTGGKWDMCLCFSCGGVVQRPLLKILFFLVLAYVVGLCKGYDVRCVFCVYCDAWSFRCSCMGVWEVCNKHSLEPHTITTTDIKTNMRYIHTSIVSRHLAQRGNNKILRIHPPHFSNSEVIFLHLTRRTIAQLRRNKSLFLKSYFHNVDTKSHLSL